MKKAMTIYDFKARLADGKEIAMEQYKGRVLLIVNTATGCGFTPQYEGLEKLYKTYHSRGFEVLDFPCNQFGHQAPGTDEEIGRFCTLKYDTTFPRFAKIDVNGHNALPLYKWLKNQKKGLLTNGIKWNFTKFLVDREGKVVKRFGPMVTPAKIEGVIRKLL